MWQVVHYDTNYHDNFMNDVLKQGKKLLQKMKDRERHTIINIIIVNGDVNVHDT